MTLIYIACALCVVGAILIVGPGKKSMPLFFTGAVVGVLGAAAMMVYSLIGGISPLKIVLLVIWLLIIVATIGYVIRDRAKQRKNQ